MICRSAAAALVMLGLAAPATRAQSPADYLPREPGAQVPPPSEVSPPEETGPITPVPPPGPQDAGPRFTLTAIALQGATAVAQADLQPVWAGLLGQDVTVATLDAVVERITAAYRERGYVLSQALLPAQSIENGVVHVLIVEGFIDRLELAGGAPNQQAAAARLFEPVVQDRPFALETLERSTLLARDMFGGGVETVLEPSPGTFAAADMSVFIEPDPWTGFAALDNRGSRLYGAWTLGGGASTYNLLGLNERLDFLVAGAASDGSLAFGQARIDVPLPFLTGTVLDGGRLEISGDKSRADPDLSKSGSPEDLNVIQNESNIGAALLVPFVRTRARNLFGRAGFVWRESENATGFSGSDETDTDRLLVLEARLDWDHAGRAGGISRAEALIHQGVSIAGTTQIGATGPAAGNADFTMAAFTLSHLQQIGTSPWSVYGLAMGQAASDVLPDSERFSLGDATIGRGFAPGNTSGDAGYGGRVELRRLFVRPVDSGAVTATEVYAFGDYGRAYDRAIERDGQKWETLASAGIGARIDINDWLTLTPEIARQIRGVAHDTTGQSHETRFYIGAVARF